MGHPCLWWVEIAKSNRRSFAALRMTNSTCGFVLSHPSEAWMGHTFRVLGERRERQMQVLRSPRRPQDDIAKLEFVLSHPSEAWMGHTFRVLGERRERQMQILRPPRRPQDDIAKLEFVVSHPSGKDKDAARVGHPCLCWIETGGWGSWYPTLAARTKTPRGWGTQVVCGLSLCRPRLG